jgi:hypothetical protein
MQRAVTVSILSVVRSFSAMASVSPVIQSVTALPFGAPFDTSDPWLFAVYHRDEFPAGDDNMRVPGGKRGNGADFELSATKRWRFYHGDRIPGFPQHPHKGLLTATFEKPLRGPILILP